MFIEKDQACEFCLFDERSMIVTSKQIQIENRKVAPNYECELHATQIV